MSASWVMKKWVYCTTSRPFPKSIKKNRCFCLFSPLMFPRSSTWKKMTTTQMCDESGWKLLKVSGLVFSGPLIFIASAASITATTSSHRKLCWSECHAPLHSSLRSWFRTKGIKKIPKSLQNVVISWREWSCTTLRMGIVLLDHKRANLCTDKSSLISASGARKESLTVVRFWWAHFMMHSFVSLKTFTHGPSRQNYHVCGMIDGGSDN